MSEADVRPAGTFAALHNPRYRRMWLGSAMVFFSVTGQTVARGWLARELTGSNAGLGGVYLGFGLAMALATPIAGVVADRFAKRTVIMTSTLLMAAGAAAVGFAVAIDAIEYWMLVAGSIVQAIGFSFYIPARTAYIGQLVDRETVRNAVILAQVGNEGTRVVGPALAGVLIAVPAFGSDGVFLGGAVLFLAALLIQLGLPVGKPATDRRRQSPWADVTAGASYIRHQPGLSLLAGTSLGVVIVGYPVLSFLPTLADEIFHRGPGAFGVLSAVSAVGALVAGIATARRNRMDPWWFLTLSGMGFALSLGFLAVAPTFGLALLALVFIGATSLGFQTTDQALLLQLSDHEFHGRVQSVVVLGFSGFGIAALPLGVLADEIGLRATLGIMGALVGAFIVVFALRAPQYRSLELTRART